MPLIIYSNFFAYFYFFSIRKKSKIEIVEMSNQRCENVFVNNILFWLKHNKDVKYININIESDTCDLQTLNVRPLNLLQLPKIIVTIYKQKIFKFNKKDH